MQGSAGEEERIRMFVLGEGMRRGSRGLDVLCDLLSLCKNFCLAQEWLCSHCVQAVLCLSEQYVVEGMQHQLVTSDGLTCSINWFVWLLGILKIRRALLCHVGIASHGRLRFGYHLNIVEASLTGCLCAVQCKK